jgi:hypothetical protein
LNPLPNVARVALLAAGSAGAACAQTAFHAPVDFAASLAPRAAAYFASSYSSYSSSTAAPRAESLPNAPFPAAGFGEGTGGGGAFYGQALPSSGEYYWGRFGAYAVSFRLGSGGLGGELATPLSHKLNLRGGAQFLSLNVNVTDQGVIANGNLKLRNVFGVVDYYPFHHSTFHVSPGVQVYNVNGADATLLIPGGQQITLGGQDYTSDPADPIKGNTSVYFGDKVAPRITVGFGNMFPRNGGHWSFPTDLGIEYTSAPTVQLALTGSECDPYNGCASIDDPRNQPSIDEERQRLANKLRPARFFPIISFGVAYRLGSWSKKSADRAR